MLLLENFVDVISRANVIAGIILAAVGLALTLLAKKITRIARKKQDIDEADNNIHQYHNLFLLLFTKPFAV